MGLPRSTFYDAPAVEADDAEVLAKITAICDEFETYGYRRVGAEFRHQGLVVNGKKIRRLMRAHDLQPRRRRRFVATTDSDHESPIFPNLAKGLVVHGPNQLWVGDPLQPAGARPLPAPHPGRAAGQAGAHGLHAQAPGHPERDAP